MIRAAGIGFLSFCLLLLEGLSQVVRQLRGHKPMANKTIKVRIYGRVQGVYFRHHTKLMADGLGLNGWVKNCPDGSVEALCSGSSDTVNQMIDWLHMGPDSAVVNRIDIDELEYQDSVQNEFTIRY